jgi:HEPN domain-containing protein
MAPDPIRLADTREWLARAEDDMRAAGIDLAAEPPLIRDVLFHCQQAVEKVLKAFLRWHDKPFRKTHELRVLGKQCVAIEPGLEPVLRNSFHLTDNAWIFRYPGHNSSLPEGCRLGLPVYPANGTTVLTMSDFDFMQAWVNYCRYIAKRLPPWNIDKSAPMPWRARDVEMAVFQAERSGLPLPPLPPVDED